jgi:hypothetical protein
MMGPEQAASRAGRTADEIAMTNTSFVTDPPERIPYTTVRADAKVPKDRRE